MSSDSPHTTQRNRKARTTGPLPSTLKPPKLSPEDSYSLTDRPAGEIPFRAIVELAPDAIVVTDTTGRITLVNRQTEHWFGYAREELLGQQVEVLVPERFHAVLLQHRAQYVAAPRARPAASYLQLWGRHRDAHEFPIDISLRPLAASGAWDRADSNFAVTCVIRDATERQQLEIDRVAAEIASQELRSLLATATTMAQQQADTQTIVRSWDVEATIEAMPDAVGIYDAEGRLVLANSAMRTLLGLDSEPAYAEVPPEERARRMRIRHPDGRALQPEEFGITRLLQGEVLSSADPTELQVRTLDGRELWLNISGAPLCDDQGRMIGAVAAARDVTGRRRLERRPQEALQVLLEVAHTLVEQSVTDRDGQTSPYQTTRKVAQRLASLTCRVLGCKCVGLLAVESEMRRQRALAVVGLTPEQERRWWAEAEQLPCYGEGTNQELLARFEAGEALVIDMTEPPYDALPNPFGVTTSLYVPMRIGTQVVGVLALDYGRERHAFTEEERALAGAVGQLAALVIERERLFYERAQAQANELALQEANARMLTFLSIASHELRTPVTAIAANLQLLTHRLQAQPLAELDRATLVQLMETTYVLAEHGQRGVRRLKRLTDDLVDVSRIQADKLELQPAVCDLAALVGECVEEQRQAHPGRVISLALPEDRPVLVMMDLDRIGQVVTNYLTNALKYSPEDRPVEVRLEMDEGSSPIARVSVRDQGAGITSEQQQRIWEPFYRAENSAVQSGSAMGLGLGLHISKSIVQRHGGQVGVESSRAGSTFWFTVPLAPA